MSVRHAFLATLFLAAGAAGVRAQEPTPEPRAERSRHWVFPQYRFDFRVPRMTVRMAPRIRIDADRIRTRVMERSQMRMNRSWELMDRMRNRQFELRDHLRQIRPNIQGRVMERMQERMNQRYKIRPFMYRRHYRDI